ncbi:MAG: Gfo/Idh/MocA family oxidoreductase [Clostridia bacterium]
MKKGDGFKLTGNVVKIGVFGAGRGESYASMVNLTDAKVVAVCDALQEKAERLKCNCAPDAVIYTDFNEFLTHEMDAVILCNYFDEHAPYAIQAMKAGKHVMSECLSNITVAEGVELCRTAEATGMIYKLAENYPYCASNMEMRRIYLGGSLGRVLYGEGEYIHPMKQRDRNQRSPGIKHWRSWIPATYYITHALAPLMYITDAMPVEVNARSVYAPELIKGTAASSGDALGIVLCTMDNGALFRVTGWANMAGHGNWYRINGTRGAVESVRGNQGNVMLGYNSWDIPEGAQAHSVYEAQWPSNAHLADKAGHGGGDFWVVHHFVESIKNGSQPYFNVYRAAAVSTAGLMGWRSVLNGGAPVKLPDFYSEESRKQFENDRFVANPFADVPEELRLPNSTTPGVHPGPGDLEEAYKDWEKCGFDVVADGRMGT